MKKLKVIPLFWLSLILCLFLISCGSGSSSSAKEKFIDYLNEHSKTEEYLYYDSTGTNWKFYMFYHKGSDSFGISMYEPYLNYGGFITFPNPGEKNVEFYFKEVSGANSFEGTIEFEADSFTKDSFTEFEKYSGTYGSNINQHAKTAIVQNFVQFRLYVLKKIDLSLKDFGLNSY